ncbi:MAG: YafY family transcriptional regulator [Clostridia bacterium]|nr:YafY family transcriptional regulator [Clostridia bacterium]
MKYEIMLSILFELLSKKCVKASYLAEKYECTIRSVYRYIESLEMTGVPIYTIRGSKGGFSIIDTFKLPSTFLTPEEYEQTINALTAVNSSVPAKNLSNAIIKLKATVKNEYSGFDLKSGNLIIDGGPWGDTVGYKSKIAVISKSLEEHKKMFIRYHDRNGETTERIINPHFIVFKEGLWYVYAFCNLRKRFRLFKTGRIEYAHILNETFVREDFGNNKKMPEFKFWHDEVKAEQAVLTVNKKRLSDVEEWIGVENVTEKDGVYTASATLPFDNGLVMKIMSFGENVTVVSPDSLKEKIKSTAEKILKNY